MGSKLTIKLVRSVIGHPKNQKMTVKTLGLHRLGSSVVQDDSPQIRGMVRTVRHLVRVEQMKEEKTKRGEE